MTGGGTTGVFENDDDGNESEQPVDGWFWRHKSGLFRLGWWLVHPADDSEKEGRRPAAHQDAGERLDAADEPPLAGQHQVAVAGRGVSHGAKIEGRWEVGHGVSPRVEKRPYRYLDQMQENDPSGRLDKHPGRKPKTRVHSCGPLAHPSQRRRHTHGVHHHAQGHQRPGDEKFREH